jgi:hypothetical protein
MLLLAAACSVQTQGTNHQQGGGARTPETNRVPSTVAPALPSEMTREEMVASLTTHAWCDMESLAYTNPSPPRSLPASQLTLRRDGTYETFIVKDTIEPRIPPRNWNLRKTEPGRGVLYLASEDGVAERIVLLHFLSADEIEVRGLWPNTSVYTYLRCQPLPVSGSAGQRELPEVPLPSVVGALSRARWKLVTENSGNFVATSVEFLPDGRVHSTYGPESCKAWRQPGHDRILETRVDGTCVDEFPFNRSRVRQTGRFVRMGKSVYLPEAEVTAERYLFLHFALDVVEGVASYMPPLRRTPLPVQVEVWNLTDRPAEIGPLNVSQLTGDPTTESRRLGAIDLGPAIKPRTSVQGAAVLDLALPREDEVENVRLVFALKIAGRLNAAPVRVSF